MVSGLERHSQTMTELAGSIIYRRATSVGGVAVRGRVRMGEKG